MDPVTYTPKRWRIPHPGLPRPGVYTVESGPHYYTQETWVGNVKQGTTVEAAFEALRHHAAPFQERRVSKTGDVTDILGRVGGRVSHFVFPEHLTIVNTTLPGHVFDPGNVSRKIVQKGDDIYVVTQGYGTGFFRNENEKLSPYLWELVDSGIRSRLNRPTGAHDIDNIMNTTIPEMHGAGGNAFGPAAASSPEIVSPPDMPATGPRPFLPGAFLPGALGTTPAAD
jgi:hypothetical protein